MTTESKKVACGNCWSFGQGKCRRMTPVAGAEERAIWPKVEIDDWCGYWRPVVLPAPLGDEVREFLEGGRSADQKDIVAHMVEKTGIKAATARQRINRAIKAGHLIEVSNGIALAPSQGSAGSRNWASWGREWFGRQLPRKGEMGIESNLIREYARENRIDEETARLNLHETALEGIVAGDLLCAYDMLVMKQTDEAYWFRDLTLGKIVVPEGEFHRDPFKSSDLPAFHETAKPENKTAKTAPEPQEEVAPWDHAGFMAALERLAPSPEKALDSGKAVDLFAKFYPGPVSLDILITAYNGMKGRKPAWSMSRIYCVPVAPPSVESMTLE